jgi:integrative and conjugative element protein (TIGR02256 family)
MWESLYEGIELSFDPPSYIIFSKEVISLMTKRLQRCAKSPEVGGLLLGYIRETHFDVRCITIPYPKDICRRTAFYRNDEKHIIFLEETLKKSNGRIVYLGEWHTHPEKNPIPSSIDIQEWNHIKSTRNYPLVFLILGLESFYIKRY